MNKFIGLILIAITGISCAQNDKADYKAERDEVMKFHDVVMADNGVLISNQMKLDTLLHNMRDLKVKFPELDTLKEKQTIAAMLTELTRAEDLMNDWMHQFEPDVTGQSNEDAIKYFKSEKVKIAAVDSLYKKEIKTSGTYLSKFGK